jgi:hypothetical protein
MGGPPRPRVTGMEIAEAARKGRLELYVALRGLIAAQIDAGCLSRELSALVILLLEVSREIERMTRKPEPEEMPPAELADR